MSRTSRMAALQSGQRPRPARSSRAQVRQKVWPHGMKAAPLARAMHTQQQPPPTAPFPVSGSASSSAADAAAAAAGDARCCCSRTVAPEPALHCRSVCSSSAIRDTLSPCSSSSSTVGGDTAGSCRGGVSGGGGGGVAASVAGTGAGRETARWTSGSPSPPPPEDVGSWSSRMISSKVRAAAAAAAAEDDDDDDLSAAMADARVTAARRPAARSSSSRSLSRSRRLHDPAAAAAVPAGPTAASWSASVTLRRSTLPSMDRSRRTELTLLFLFGPSLRRRVCPEREGEQLLLVWVNKSKGGKGRLDLAKVVVVMEARMGAAVRACVRSEATVAGILWDMARYLRANWRCSGPYARSPL